MNIAPPSERASAANLQLEVLLTEQEYARITQAQRGQRTSRAASATGLSVREVRSARPLSPGRRAGAPSAQPEKSFSVAARSAVKPESKPPLLRVRNWDALYENNRSREMKRTRWFPAPNDLSADGYVDVVTHDRGAAHFGVWNAILMVASRAKPRRGLLIKEDGQPHTAKSLAKVTRLAEETVSETLERLIAIGLLDVVDDDSPETNNLAPHPGAGIPQGPAGKPQEGAVEGKGIEHHHQEGKRKEKERNGRRTELQGMEGAGEDSTTEHSGARESSNPSPKNGDDDSETPATVYASAEDELKAIYQTKGREPITLQVLDAIQANLELGRGGHKRFRRRGAKARREPLAKPSWLSSGPVQALPKERR